MKECIIAENTLKNNVFYLTFLLNDSVKWLDVGLPTPTYLENLNRGVMMAYAIDGYFGTKTNQTYLNDIIARFLVTFKNEGIQRLKQKPNIQPSGHYLAKVYKLKEFQALKSLSKKVKAQSRADKFADSVFWAIKFFCEDCIEKQGTATFEQLFNFALDNFEYKEKSTLRAKCRSIWNWYHERDWKIAKRFKQNKEQYMATRQEHMKKLKAKEEKNNYTKIANIVTGLYAETYKKKSGAWHIGRIAEDTGLTAKTVSKHLKKILA